MPRGIFRLKQVYEEQLSGNWSTKGDVWLTPSPFLSSGPAPFGYFGGGPGPISTVDRIDYSNDTAAAATKGPLSQARQNLAATGSASFGYFGGGGAPGTISTVDRIDYSNDTATAPAKGTLSVARSYLAATGNASFGYFGGGRLGPKSTVDRIDYSNDTGTTPSKGPLSSARQGLSATGNSDFGYFGGGNGPKSTVDRIDYSNDTATASSKGPLSLARYNLSATGNSSFGYFGGGRPGPVSTVDRVDYSNDTATASAKGPLSAAKRYLAATGNANFGYFGGGNGPISTVDRIDYSNDTATAVAKGPLSSGRDRLGASSSQANAITTGTLFPASSVRDNVVPQGTDFGYFGGGAPASQAVRRIDFSTDTATASPKGALIVGRKRHASVGSANFGYVGGGSNPGGSTFSSVERIDYSNDTATASAKGSLTAAVAYLAAVGNSNFGYFTSGSPGSRVNRIDYSNDTATASQRGNISPATNVGATGNSNFGYVAGGSSGDSTVQRIDYSNDSNSPTPKGPLNTGRSKLAATGNANFGYFGGGIPHPANPDATAVVDRIDYSNDTATASPKGSLSAARKGLAATGNTSFGYFAGGAYSPSNEYTLVDRIDYSNDTATAVAKGPLNTAENTNFEFSGMSSRANAMPLKGPGILEVPVSLGAFSVTTPGPAPQGTDFGYSIGGGTTSVQRIDYSNDTATESLRGPVPTRTRYTTGVSSITHGYRLGGLNDSTPGPVSTVDRIDYSNDTATGVTKGPLTAIWYRTAGSTGNLSFGYIGGGMYGPTQSTTTIVNRIDYSNDTATALAKGPLSAAKYGFGATGTTNFGYFGGGGPGPKSSVDRIDYSNDTATAVAKGPLSIARRTWGGVTGNASFGYWMGGSATHATGSSTVDRVDYSNDTATAASKGPLTGAQRYSAGGVSSSSHGYAMGGQVASSILSTVDRIDYSNDTATALVRGPLPLYTSLAAGMSSRDNGFPAGGPTTVNYPAGTLGTPNTGYFAGGRTPGYASSMYRIDYSNDTATALSKGQLTQSKKVGGGVSNDSFAYFGGGRLDSGGPSPWNLISNVDRIDYLNDTATAVVKGPLTANRYNIGATGNKNFGYFGGGWTGFSIK